MCRFEAKAAESSYALCRSLFPFPKKLGDYVMWTAAFLKKPRSLSQCFVESCQWSCPSRISLHQILHEQKIQFIVKPQIFEIVCYSSKIRGNKALSLSEGNNITLLP